jgi:ABC-type transporter lipoprotein component MlaA
MTKVYNKITPKMADKVLTYFYNNEDNRSSVIAKKLKVKEHFVNYILDIHLSYKKNAYVIEKYYF